MTEHILAGAPPIMLTLRRTSRARRISLRISQLDGRVTLTLPQKTQTSEAIDFAREKESWIRKHLDARGEDVPVEIGAIFPLGGQMHRVVAGSGRGVKFGDSVVEVPGTPDRTGARLAGHLKQIARIRLTEASDHFSAKLGRPYARLTLRDTRSRWGSCTSDGRLMYSWRLILAPPIVLDYVVAHEVAHLSEMNHSPAFWAEVSTLFGDYKAPRKWLRANGSDLHRYRF